MYVYICIYIYIYIYICILCIYIICIYTYICIYIQRTRVCVCGKQYSFMACFPCVQAPYVAEPYLFVWVYICARILGVWDNIILSSWIQCVHDLCTLACARAHVVHVCTCLSMWMRMCTYFARVYTFLIYPSRHPDATRVLLHRCTCILTWIFSASICPESFLQSVRWPHRLRACVGGVPGCWIRVRW